MAVTFPELISTPTLTSKREMFGVQKVADAIGVGTYEKNQNTTGLNCAGWLLVHVSGGLEPNKMVPLEFDTGQVNEHPFDDAAFVH
jgi:hypothetical protein